MLVTNALAPGITEPLALEFGYTPAFATAAVTAAAALLATRLLREPARNVGPLADSGAQSRVLYAGRVLAAYYGAFLLGAGIGAMFTYVQPFALDKGATSIGGFFFGYVASALFVRLTLARLADRVGPVNVAVVAFALYALTVGFTAILEPDWLAVCGVSLGASHGLAYPALTAAGFSAVGPALRSRFMGWYTFGFNMGFAVTVLTLGPVVDAHGYPVLFVTVGMMIASGGLALWFTREQTLSGQPATAHE
jgi:predicted MFS family arabinose efflux permease